VASSIPYAVGNIARNGNELMLVTGITTGALTVTRGWNGSTAATHLISTAVTIWRPEPDIVEACAVQAARWFRRGEAIFGITGGGEMGVQPVQIGKLDPDVDRVVSRYQRQM
jgi:hypothetical protein